MAQLTGDPFGPEIPSVPGIPLLPCMMNIITQCYYTVGQYSPVFLGHLSVQVDPGI